MLADHAELFHDLLVLSLISEFDGLRFIRLRALRVNLHVASMKICSHLVNPTTQIVIDKVVVKVVELLVEIWFFSYLFSWQLGSNFFHLLFLCGLGLVTPILLDRGE